MDFTKIEILLDVIAFIASAALGVAVFKRDTKSWTNRLFLVLSLLINAYIVVNYISLHPPMPTPESQLLWIRIVMFTCSFIGPVLVLLAHTFPNAKITFRTRYFVPLIILMLGSAVSSLMPWVFSGIDYPGGKPVPVPGPGIPIFAVDFVGMFILSFIILLYKYRHAAGVEKSKLLYLLLGVLASFTLMGATTVIFVVLLQTSSFVFLGPVFTVILMACIAYAIVRYQMFNLKVFAAQVFIVVLWVVLLAQTLTGGSVSERLVDGFVLLATVVIGIYLVRSVGREIRQREDLERLTRQLEASNAKLQELDQARSDFITIASHQLRTLPTTLKWYLSALRAGDYGKLEGEILDTVAKAEAVNNSMISLIDDLLNASRIERGKMEFVFEPTDVLSLVKTTVEQLGPLALIKNLHLNFAPPQTPPPMVAADREKIRQVINNFVDNAVKYTTKGSINIFVEQTQNEVSVRVKDTGKGFTVEQGKVLFEKYTRGQDAALHSTGLGLGLYVARVVIDQHKGRIWAKSDGEDKGAEFGFALRIHNDLPEHASLNLAQTQGRNDKIEQK